MDERQPPSQEPGSGTDTARSRPAAARAGMLDAAERTLQEIGYAALTTREVARRAGVPLSQIHYHFGSKKGLVLALFEHLNARLLDRQARLFESHRPLSEKWEMACDYLDEDLASGYVRVLHELTAAGWSDREIAALVRAGLDGWHRLIDELTEEAAARLGAFGPFTPRETTALIGAAFMGAESNLLLDYTDAELPMRSALRKIGALIRLAERRAGG